MRRRNLRWVRQLLARKRMAKAFAAVLCVSLAVPPQFGVAAELARTRSVREGDRRSSRQTRLRWNIRRLCAMLLSYCIAHCLCYSDIKVNLTGDMLYPIGYPVNVESDENITVILNGDQINNFPYYLAQPGIYTLEIYGESSMLTLNFEVVDYIPLVAKAIAYVVESPGTSGEATTIMIEARNFELDPRYALKYVLPNIAIRCDAIITPSLTLYSPDLQTEYRATRVWAFEDRLLAEFKVTQFYFSNQNVIENLFIVGTIQIGAQRAIFETTNLVLGGNFPILEYLTVPYCPGGGECSSPRCGWRSQILSHVKRPLKCNQGTSLHGAQISGESAGSTMWGEGWAIDTLPLLAAFCADAKIGEYRRRIYHYVENPDCPCPGQQTIEASMHPQFTACAFRGGFSAFYWFSYAKAGGWMSVSASGLGSAEAKGGVHVGGSNQISFGNSGITVTLVAAPPGGCSPFADNKSYRANISSTTVTCSSGAAIEVYAEGGMGGAATAFAKAEAFIRDGSCNTQLVLTCPCCGGGIVTIR